MSLETRTFYEIWKSVVNISTASFLFQTIIIPRNSSLADISKNTIRIKIYNCSVSSNCNKVCTFHAIIFNFVSQIPAHDLEPLVTVGRENGSSFIENMNPVLILKSLNNTSAAPRNASFATASSSQGFLCFSVHN